MQMQEIEKLREESKHGILEIEFSQDFGARGRNHILITEMNEESFRGKTLSLQSGSDRVPDYVEVHSRGRASKWFVEQREWLFNPDEIVYATAESMLESTEEFTEKHARQRIREIDEQAREEGQISDENLQEYENYKAFVGIE